MTLNIILIFTFIALLSLIPFERIKGGKVLQNIAYVLSGLFLMFFAAFRPEGVDRDYIAYINWFQSGYKNTEISFILLTDFIKSIRGDASYIFLFYAVLGVGCKLIGINKYSPYVFSSLLVYVAYLYNLQELTQIRAGVATAFLLLSVQYVVDRKFWLFLLMFSLASFFHYSAIFMFFIYFLDPKKINPYHYILAILLSYALLPLVNYPLELITPYLPDFLQKKAIGHEYDNDLKLNIFNAWQIIRCVVAVILLLNISRIQSQNKYFVIMLKLYTFGICSFVWLSFSHVFASRISDLVFLSDFVVFTGFIYLFRQKIVGRILVIILSAFFLYLNLKHIGIFYE